MILQESIIPERRPLKKRLKPEEIVMFNTWFAEPLHVRVPACALCNLHLDIRTCDIKIVELEPVMEPVTQNNSLHSGDWRGQLLSFQPSIWFKDPNHIQVDF